MSKGKLVANFSSQGRTLTKHEIDLAPFDGLQDVPVIELTLEGNSFEIPITLAAHVADLIKLTAKTGSAIQKTMERNP